MAEKLVGLSVSFNVRDIRDGRIPEESVAFIAAAFNDIDGFMKGGPDGKDGIKAYKETYWKDGDDPASSDKAEAIARRLHEEGRLVGDAEARGLPAGQKPFAHNIADGAWLDVEKGQQFHLRDGERVYSEHMGEGVEEILKYARDRIAKEILAERGIEQRSGGRGVAD